MNISEPQVEVFNNEDEIDLKLLCKRIFRRKSLFALITSIATFSNIVLTAFETPSYKGNFEIIVSNQNKSMNNMSNLIPQSLLNLSALNLKGGNDNMTQEFILKSPLVLLPVYEFVKEEYNLRGENTKNLSYKKWVTSKLSVRFVERTNVLNIDFIDQDKDLIIKTLNMISNEYQKYSKRDREKELTKGLAYLIEQQKKLKLKTNNSMREFNKFAIENGLGDIDGFPSVSFSENIDKSQNADLESNNSLQKKNAGQRFASQFNLLKEYETAYIDYSSKLKPNSRYLKELKLKIDNLKSSLKRPNEILLKYRELTKNANRDENILLKIESQIDVYRLEIANQQEPWELISTPTIEDLRISPKRKQSALITLLLSSIFASFICILFDLSKGFIYELSELKLKLSLNYLDSIYLNNLNLSSKVLNNFHKNISNSKTKNKIYLIDTTSYLQNESNKVINFKESIDKFYEIVPFDKQLNLENYEKLVFILSSGNLKQEDIIYINQYQKVIGADVLGWFYLDSETEL